MLPAAVSIRSFYWINSVIFVYLILHYHHLTKFFLKYIQYKYVIFILIMVRLVLKNLFVIVCVQTQDYVCDGTTRIWFMKIL